MLQWLAEPNLVALLKNHVATFVSIFNALLAATPFC